MSLQIFFFALTVSPPPGLLVTLGGMSKLKIVNLPARFYVLIMRRTPLVLQLLLIFYALEPPLEIQLDRVLAAEVVFALNYTAYFAEIYCGGLGSTPDGQREAAKVLGYTESQALFHIVLLQMIERITPPMGDEFITLVKDTSLAQVVSVVELLKVTSQRVLGAVGTTPLVIAGPSYLVVNGIIARAFTVLENRLNYYQ